jgi:O-antigen ligase
VNRLSVRLLQLGLIAIVLVAIPYKMFELDRYFVPKELVLNLVALAVGLPFLLRRRRLGIDAADILFALFLVWSVASTLLATNHWLAQRALGISVSSAIIFWASRRLGEEDSYRPILIAAAVAAVLASLTSLAQAYGLDSDYFTMNRAPGGTLGNRNFVAHIGAIGLPALIFATVTARRSFGAVIGWLGTAIIAAALVLSRSRAAWLAVAISLVILAIPLFASRKHWSGAAIGGRLAVLLLAGAIGGAAATVLPNTLNWKSDSPYLDSARGVVDYTRGSGRGRIAQYKNSLRMAAAEPVLGVGPGNWPVRYTSFAPSNDRSIADDGMTANPWPSSDWIAFISERGIVAALAMLGVFVTLFVGAFRGWPEVAEREFVLLKLALVGTIVATMVVSAFDVALLLAAPSFLIWSVFGAASGVRPTARELNLSSRAWMIAASVLVLILVTSVARSATQAMAMTSVNFGAKTAGWVRGAQLDPGSYRINMRAGEIYANRGRCEIARPYARRALGLFPNSPAAKRLVKRCG